MINLSNNLRSGLQNFSSDYERFATYQLAAVALQRISQRWREKGTAPDGAAYKPYSSTPTLIGGKSFLSKGKADTFFSKNKNVKGEEKKLEWFTVNGHHLALLKGGYKQLRREQGLQVAHKDFIYRAELIKALKPIKTVRTETGFLTEAGVLPNDKANEMKLLGNEKREGKELLNVTKEEEAELTKMADTFIEGYLKRMMNG